MAARSRSVAVRPDARSRIPRYLQVASVLRRRISEGVWPVGARIATLEELEKEFDVARVTVRQAIDLLASEGLVRSYQGRGTFVTKAPGIDRFIQLATDWDSLIAPIKDNVPFPLPKGHEPAPRIEDGDGTAADSYVFLRSVQKRDGKPYAYARVHIAKHVHALAPKAFASRVALAVLSELGRVEISRAHQTLIIGAADVEAARVLEIPLDAPTAEARCVVTDTEGVIIYVGEITYPGDSVRLNIELISEGG